MSLFKKKCMYCKNKIDKDSEIKKNVKIPGFIGTSPKHFCSNEHANSYEREVEEYSKKSKSGGSCCG